MGIDENVELLKSIDGRRQVKNALETHRNRL